MTQQAAELSFRPIGLIRSPHSTSAGTPIQSVYAQGVEGEVIVDEELDPALADIDGFERLWLIYFFHRAESFKPRVVPYRDVREHGLFATRSPCRPNPIGISVVELLGRERNVLRVRGVDILDGTPLLDIKPYVSEFDCHSPSRSGWLDDSRGQRPVADQRFHRKPGSESRGQLAGTAAHDSLGFDPPIS